MRAMNETPKQSRHRIGLGAFLAAFSVVALWLAWAGSVTRILDQVRAKRKADRAAIEAARGEAAHHEKVRRQRLAVQYRID
jgi:hypothetical protein